MFTNYWNYKKYLMSYIGKLIKGKVGEYKIYTPANDYGDDEVRVIVTKKSNDLGKDQRIPLIKDVHTYRVYWSDGTKSRWFIPGKNDKLGDGTRYDLIKKGSHVGEIIVIIK